MAKQQQAYDFSLHFKTTCPYTRTCAHQSNDNPTCTEGPQNLCGPYRQRMQAENQRSAAHQ